jgi:dihydropteroate synthase
MPEKVSLSRASLRSPTHTLVMGVINTTPDSFSDGGVHLDPEVAIASGLQMFRDGADMVDVGGESTRPGSAPTPVEEEMHRVIPVIRGIRSHKPDALVSIDTRRRKMAEAAIEAGAGIINDVSGFRDDPTMVELAREAETGLIVMHMLGRPGTMQKNIRYRSFPDDIHDFFQERIYFLENAGISRDRIAIDPGIGFGKSFDQNLVLINRLDVFQDLRVPILIGPSRKAFLGKILDEPIASRRDGATAAAVVAAVLRGASIVRVHDVPRAKEACKVADAIVRERIPS